MVVGSPSRRATVTSSTAAARRIRTWLSGCMGTFYVLPIQERLLIWRASTPVSGPGPFPGPRDESLSVG